MSTLDWSFVALASGVLLFSFFGLVLLFSSLKNKKKYKMLRKKRPPKNKKKRKRFMAAKRRLESKLKKQFIWSIILLLFAGGSSFGAMYSRYYQQHRLNGKESEAIVQGYYLIDELSLQLENIKKNENPQKAIKNISNLSSKMVSFGFTKASMALKEDKQVLLNRYFNTMKQLGTNLHEQSLETLQNEEALAGYVNDINKLEMSQKEVFKQFKINEAALKKKQ
ncbi:MULTISPECIES: hypothetical protein [unclassified Enterococcus]|uniref:hypothetical protein n=1 Tax=unclassified Enterococcus TaxID=2608891 RepID=UPI001CE21D05|nr:MULTISPECIES: hypothetical protein [unclassified Enterococcus]MCA5013659.1 hypothetical protein [Enterococcus sp. S23]MCA5016909.1 hypothetical protein [Enterococcus sp. S22(2020)]